MTKLAIVTGANKGIGYAIVKALCKDFDGDVLLCSRDLERGEKAINSLKNEGLNPKLFQLAIDDLKTIENLKDFIKSNYGGIDILVNNAAIAYPAASTVPFIEQANETLRINFFALVTLCDHLYPLLNPHSRVVHVSSSAGMLRQIQSEELKKKFTSPTLTVDQLCDMMKTYLKDVEKGVHIENGWARTAYSNSKVAVTALAFIHQRQFDSDSREDIVVNAVHPGYVDTDMTNHKGVLTIEQGAIAPTFCALLPPNVKEPRGQMVFENKDIVDWNQ